MYDVPVLGAPNSAIATPDEQSVFVTIFSKEPRQPTGVGILKCTGGRYRFDRIVPLEAAPLMMALTHDASMLVVPDANIIAFLDAGRALAGSADAISGWFKPVPDGTAVYAVVTPDDRFAFIVEEFGGTVTVVDLQRVRSGHTSTDDIVSEVRVGDSASGLAMSRDGTHLFVTVPAGRFPRTCAPEGTPQPGARKHSPGAIVVIDVAKATSDPSHAVIADVPAGCTPMRDALSPDGETLWVTNRGSNTVSAFSVVALIAGGSGAHIADIAVGAEPVPIIVTPDGRYVLAGNTARFEDGPPANQEVFVIDARTHAVVGRIPVGKFPRQFSMTASGSLIFLCNFNSQVVTVIDPKAIPSLMISGHP